MITLYATTRHGEGWVMKLGSYECVEDIVIHAGMFERDVELTFLEEDFEPEEFDEGMDDTTEKEIKNTRVPTTPIPWIPSPIPPFPISTAWKLNSVPTGAK